VLGILMAIPPPWVRDPDIDGARCWSRYAMAAWRICFSASSINAAASRAVSNAGTVGSVGLESEAGNAAPCTGARVRPMALPVLPAISCDTGIHATSFPNK
jgi:hypothetical protein